jgi:hypothetical protein
MVAFAGQRCLDALLLTWLQVIGVTLDLFNYVLIQHFALEPTQSAFDAFPLVELNFGHGKFTSIS